MWPKPVVDDEARASMKAWLDNWKIAGPLLEAERWERVRALSDEDAWQETNGLLQSPFPNLGGDGGEGLRLQQAVFALTRRA